jgi:hypothetical protein
MSHLIGKKYNLAPQTTIISPDGLSNYQGLHFDPLNYQNLRKISILAKYSHNTPVTCNFSIKNNNIIKQILKKLIFFLKKI